MGVKGLEALVLQQEGKWGTPIDFAKAGREYQEQHSQMLTLVVDGGSFLHFALKRAGPEFFMYGYNPQLMINHLEHVCNLFLDRLHLRLVIFMDGMSQPGKEAELLQRERRKRKMIESLCAGTDVEEIFRMRTGEYETMSLTMTKLLYASYLNERAKKSDGQMQVFQMEYEADLEVAR
jgi:hypothetical protein